MIRLIDIPKNPVLDQTMKDWYWDNWKNEPKYTWHTVIGDRVAPSGGLRLAVEPDADPEIYVDFQVEGGMQRHLRTLESLHQQYGREVDVRQEVLDFTKLTEIDLFLRIGEHFVQAGYAVYMSGRRFAVYRLTTEQREAFASIAVPEPGPVEGVLVKIMADAEVVLPVRHRRAGTEVLCKGA